MDRDELAELFSQGAALRPVPQQRIREKVDACMSRRDYARVERTLLYWLDEARAAGDRRGQLMIRGEMIGHYRKTGEKDKARESEEDALRLLREMDFASSLSAATTYVNIATARCAFGENEEALGFFKKAREIYESSPGVTPELLGGLYNNMGLCCAALRRYDEALALYEMALSQMEKTPGGALERAVTKLNMANSLEDRDGMESAEHSIFFLLDEALLLLNGDGFPRDGYYAYVCEKCAPVFDYYGYFADGAELKRRAEEIYERA